MLAEQIKKLEYENTKLKELLKLQEENIPKPKECGNCRYFVRHYGKLDGIYYKLYVGHCICKVPIKKRKGKKEPTVEDTCTCFQEKRWRGDD